MRPFERFAALVLLCACFAMGQKSVGWSLAYYPEWNQGGFPPSSINWKAMSHISHFAVLPNGGGINTNGFTDAECKAVVATAHSHGVKALICVGGAGVGNGFLNATQNSATRAKFNSALIAFMKKYGYDGIDTDWEENFGSDLRLYVTWHKELRDSLNAISPRPLLTAAVEDWYANPTGMISQYVDFMDDMCYGDNASNVAADLKNLTDVGVPKSKIGIGMGLAPGGGMGEQDTNTIGAEATWAIQNGFGGIMEWDLGDGNPGKGNTAAQLWNSLVKFVPAPTATAEFEARAVESAGTLRVITNRITKHPEIIYSISSTASSAAVDLCIYDMLGVRVFKIALGHHSPGTYSVVIDKDVMGGRPLSPGNYVVKMALASKTETAIVSFVR